jgi:hypothetical protein
MADNGVKVAGELNCRCRPGAKCPRIQLFSDGSMLVTDEEQGATPVRFDRDQVQQLFVWLEQNGAG